MAVYLDHAATTPTRPAVVTAMTTAMNVVGNPASLHSTGQQARSCLESARETIAGSVGSDPIEVILTSGGTESINTALKGLFWARNRTADRPVILVPRGEHHATIDSIEWLESSSAAHIVWLPLDSEGSVSLSAFHEALLEHGDRVAFVTALWVNNEVGTINDVAALSCASAEAGVPLHIDAVAALGHLPISWCSLREASGSTLGTGLVALSLSAHKIGGPVGSGALLLSRDAQIVPLVHGGGQQRSIRSGTQDLAAAAGFAEAISAATGNIDAEKSRLTMLRDRLIAGVTRSVSDASINGPIGNRRIASNVNFAFPGCEGDSLLFLLDMAGVQVSTGSACQAGIPEPSHVLKAMGRSEMAARGALRMTLGWSTTIDDVDEFISVLPKAYRLAKKAGYSDRAVSVNVR